MSAPKVWFSTIEYRPSPPDPETGVIGLGFVIEFTTDKYWVVTAVMRAGIEVPELAGLDNLARQVLQHRLEVIQKEIDRVAALAKEPGQVLASLFTSNPWSLHISEPKEIEASIEIADASVERVQDEYVFSVYETQWLPIVQAR